MTTRYQAHPDALVMLPDGTFIHESEVRRIRLGNTIRAVANGVAFIALLLFVLFAATFVGPAPH